MGWEEAMQTFIPKVCGLVMNHEGEKGKKMLSHSQILLLLKVFAKVMDSRESEGRFRSQSLETPSVFRPERGTIYREE